MRVARAPRLLSWCILLAILLFTQSGCLVVAAAAVTGGVIAHAGGNTEAYVKGDVPAVTAAGRQAVEEMGLTVVSSTSGEAEGRVVARTASDRRVAIKVTAAGADSSRVSIRRGTFGKEAFQQEVLDRMRKSLAAGPAPTTQPVADAAPTTQPVATTTD